MIFICGNVGIFLLLSEISYYLTNLYGKVNSGQIILHSRVKEKLIILRYLTNCVEKNKSN